ncbi:MAG: efflux RND transporter periplasmic adaptor subunit [Bacillota bacterium]
MKKLLILLLIISLGLAGCGDKKSTMAEEGEAQGKQEQEAVYVKVEPVGTMDFENTLAFPGTMKPKEEVIITAKVNGVVDNVFGDIGKKVQKGDTLCKVDDTIYQIQFHKASAALNAEKIQYENLEKTYERTKALYESQALSKSDFESIESQFFMAKEMLQATENDYALAQENLSYTNIKSPITGIISEKNVLVGESIGPGSKLFTVVDIEQMYVDAGIAEKDIALIQKGQKVLIKIDALGGESMEGTVTHVGPVPDSESKTYPVKVLVKNTDQSIMPGMFSSIEIVTEAHAGALSVAKEAVLSENSVQYVYVEKNGKAYRTEVKTGFSNDKHIEITSGLKQGDKIITVGKEKVQDGSAVIVK